MWNLHDFFHGLDLWHRHLHCNLLWDRHIDLTNNLLYLDLWHWHHTFESLYLRDLHNPLHCLDLRDSLLHHDFLDLHHRHLTDNLLRNQLGHFNDPLHSLDCSLLDRCLSELLDGLCELLDWLSELLDGLCELLDWLSELLDGLRELLNWLRELLDGLSKLLDQLGHFNHPLLSLDCSLLDRCLSELFSARQRLELETAKTHARTSRQSGNSM